MLAPSINLLLQEICVLTQALTVKDEVERTWLSKDLVLQSVAKQSTLNSLKSYCFPVKQLANHLPSFDYKARTSKTENELNNLISRNNGKDKLNALLYGTRYKRKRGLLKIKGGCRILL